VISLNKHGMNNGNLFLARLKTALSAEANVFLSRLSGSPTITTNNDMLCKDGRIKTELQVLGFFMFFCSRCAVV
jgi:hypothetical protein